MDSLELKAITLLALAAIVLRLGWLVQQRSRHRKPIHGGAASLLFNFLSGMCFVAILPTVCLTVLVLRPEAVALAGLSWHPLLLAVLTLAIGSLGFALLHALAERGPMKRALQQKAAREARGWTEEDAVSSGL